MRFFNRQEKDSCPKLEISPESSAHNEIAIFALGDFGGPQPRFQNLKGVARVVVGYSGGTTENPTYKRIKDHTEALLVEFDPAVVPYKELVHFWTTLHRPINKYTPQQYRSAVWYVTKEQQQIATSVVNDWNARNGNALSTSVERAKSFYCAEEYHQDYMRKQMGWGKVKADMRREDKAKSSAQKKNGSHTTSSASR
eukprot:CAMPEP_0194221132 /NCGR_PEP_ID=MMETSP0156-20130528/29949_1 /TAXON_ID=33649 /ORGANISM="Thalassionema nitzschioides, Strain L26-B" /LENGTH=196 /DNA_ID=CAMNT_0038951435 /DNA_START=23 /DNA_END=613 /DNA_ORIENTATION=+